MSCCNKYCIMSDCKNAFDVGVEVLVFAVPHYEVSGDI